MKEHLVRAVRELAIRKGEVTLSSGAKSDQYIDLRLVSLHPVVGPLIGSMMREAVDDLDAQWTSVGGFGFGAIPIALSMMYSPGRQLTAFMVRPQVKTHGTCQRVEGSIQQGEKVLLVDDVCTTGASLLEAAKAIKEVGALPVGAAVVLDRGGGKRVSGTMPYTSLLSEDDL